MNGLNFNQQYCGSRLPCGLCRITNAPCPYASQSPDVVLCEQDTITTTSGYSGPQCKNDELKGETHKHE